MKLSKKTEAALAANQALTPEEIFKAAKLGRCETFTDEMFLMRDEHWKTPFHYLAKYGHVQKIPAHLLTLENLQTLKDQPRRWSPLDYAASFGHLGALLERLPANIKSQAVTLNAMRLAFDAGFGKQIPKENLTVAEVTALGKNETSLLHSAAASGDLDLLPRAALTERHMTHMSSFMKRSPLHLALAAGHAEQIPTELLTPKVFLTSRNQGLSVLREMHMGYHLSDVPGNVLSDPTALRTLATFPGLTPTQREIYNIPDTPKTPPPSQFGMAAFMARKKADTAVQPPSTLELQ